MTREEITNNQEYKATEAALEWWYSLTEEQRKATDIDAEPDIIDAYAEGYLKALQERDELLNKACDVLVNKLGIRIDIMPMFRKEMEGGGEG